MKYCLSKADNYIVRKVSKNSKVSKYSVLLYI